MLKSELEKIGVSVKHFKQVITETQQTRVAWRSRRNKIDPIAYERNEMIVRQLDLVIAALK